MITKGRPPLSPIPDEAPKRGETWQHRTSGSLYKIVRVSYDEETLHLRVVYEQDEDGPSFVRRYIVFMDRFRRI